MRQHVPVLALTLLAFPLASAAARATAGECHEGCPMYPGEPEVDLCPADLDGDEEVGTLDLLFLEACWGPLPVAPCDAADFNQDQEVGSYDKEYLLGNWGGCTGADLDGNGVVYVEDLMVLLANRGKDCRFDLDHNGAVGDSDENVLSTLWGSPGPLGDFDGDGVVGTADLLQLLAAAGRDCRGDLDRDGWVETCYDLEILLAEWPR